MNDLWILVETQTNRNQDKYKIQLSNTVLYYILPLVSAALRACTHV